MGSECTICVKQFGVRSDVFVSPCGHSYHQKCLQHWIKQSHICPVCRWDDRESIQDVFWLFNEACVCGVSRDEQEEKQNLEDINSAFILVADICRKNEEQLATKQREIYSLKNMLRDSKEKELKAKNLLTSIQNDIQNEMKKIQVEKSVPSTNSHSQEDLCADGSQNTIPGNTLSSRKFHIQGSLDVLNAINEKESFLNFCREKLDLSEVRVNRIVTVLLKPSKLTGNLAITCLLATCATAEDAQNILSKSCLAKDFDVTIAKENSVDLTKQKILQEMIKEIKNINDTISLELSGTSHLIVNGKDYYLTDQCALKYKGQNGLIELSLDLLFNMGEALQESIKAFV